MDRYEAGMLAWSRAGHDTGQLYVIMCVENEYVFLTDGRLKPETESCPHILNTQSQSPSPVR